MDFGTQVVWLLCRTWDKNATKGIYFQKNESPPNLTILLLDSSLWNHFEKKPENIASLSHCREKTTITFSPHTVYMQNVGNFEFQILVVSNPKILLYLQFKIAVNTCVNPMEKMSILDFLENKGNTQMPF